MCGINAVYKYTGITEADKEKLLLMNSQMRYRGPDEEGTWNDETCALAQTRLSIIGLENGRQPLFNEDQSLVLICNGEIYNYIELQHLLKKKGHIFATDTDCETILHLYEEYGEQCLHYLRGMYAFCLYDTVKKQLFVARDRVGEKTLYYSQLTTGFVFSTELKAIAKYYINELNLNERALAETIRYSFSYDLYNTFIDQIKRVDAGSCVLINENGLHSINYWKRDYSANKSLSYEYALERTLVLLRESVDLCLRSDVPVAVLLSSGIDSSAIAALAKQTGREVHVITAGYKGNYDCDERKAAAKFAFDYGLIYHEIEIDASDFQSNFVELTNFLDEPISDLASVAQWALYKKAKALGFTVLLGGLGSDELFYGYPEWNAAAESLKLRHEHESYFPWKGTNKKIAFARFFLKNWKHIIYAGYPFKINDKFTVDWMYDDYMEFAKDGRLMFGNQEVIFSDIDVHISYEGNKNEIEQLYDSIYKTFMRTQCLYLADRLGMGNSVELRSPFVDHKLVEFVSGIPFQYKYKKNEPKKFLREVLKGTLPDELLDSRKKGFTPPMDFIQQMNESYNYSILKSKKVFFNTIVADKVIDQHYKL